MSLFARTTGTTLVSVTTLGLLLLGSCGDPEAERQAKIRTQIQENYDRQMQLIRPDYVVVTYPVSASALTGWKAEEFKIVKKVLQARQIAHEVRRFSDAVVTLTKSNPTDDDPEYQAYAISDDALAASRDGKLLILNLDFQSEVYPALHPLAKQNGIDVKVWSDPLPLPKQ